MCLQTIQLDQSKYFIVDTSFINRQTVPKKKDNNYCILNDQSIESEVITEERNAPKRVQTFIHRRIRDVKKVYFSFNVYMIYFSDSY